MSVYAASGGWWGRRPRPWRALRRAYARRLSWKLALANLVVVMITTVVMTIGAVAVIALISGVTVDGDTINVDPLPQSDPDMAQNTRILAALLAQPMETRSPAELSALLAGLPPAESTGSGAFGGSLGVENDLVIAAPGGTVLASSDTAQFPPGAPLGALRPAAWEAPLRNALAGETRLEPGALLGRDPAARRLVSAYPIRDEGGRVIGALGLRSAMVPAQSTPWWETAVAVAALTGLQLVLIAAIGAVVSGIAGVILARRFGRRFRKLEDAADAIAQGRLDQRIAVTAPDEIGRLAERFNLLAARLEEVDQARRAFVSNISHELRTPLAIIRGHVEAQLDRAAAPGVAPPEEALRTIDREARTLGTLIDDLFTLTRLEETALPLQPAPLHLPEVVGAAVAGLRPLAQAQGKIAVSSLVPADLPPALADPTRVAQILNNLLYNALRHTPAGGVIVVEAAARPDGPLIEVAVTDTGTGIAPEDLPHIFDRFYRSESGQRQEGSSGLGLAIVKQLVEAQGGAVSARSALGEGTSIRFTLPRAPDAKGAPRRMNPTARQPEPAEAPAR